MDRYCSVCGNRMERNTVAYEYGSAKGKAVYYSCVYCQMPLEDKLNDAGLTTSTLIGACNNMECIDEALQDNNVRLTQENKGEIFDLLTEKWSG